MTSIFVCISLAVLMQGWDRPAIESSELAAPGTMTGSTQAQGSVASEDLDSVTAPSPSPAPAPAPKPAPPKQEVKTRWEYDDEGKPVARVENVEASPATPPVATPTDKPVAKVEVSQEKMPSGRIATFWLMMPRR